MTEVPTEKLVTVFLKYSSATYKYIFFCAERLVIFNPHKMSGFIQIQQHTVLIVACNRTAFYNAWQIGNCGHIAKNKIDGQFLRKKPGVLISVVVVRFWCYRTP